MKNSLPSILIFSSLIFLSALIANQYVPDWNKYIPNNTNDASVYYGPTKISDENLENLTIYGPASLKNTNVKEMTSVNGPVDVIHSNFRNFHINGIAHFDDVKISNELFINGPLFASNSNLNEISIASDELTLSNTKVTKLLIRKNRNKESNQRLYLEKGTIIESVVFEAKNGRVIFKDSSVKVNNLEGGKIESKNNPKI